MKPSFKYSLLIVVSLLTLVFTARFVIPASAATTIVTNNADSGPGSLRNAIANAANGDIITFDNDYTITLASQLEINKDITITGAGHHITISGNNAVRVFHVSQKSNYTAAAPTFDHLNIVNGKHTIDECAGSSVSCAGALMLEYDNAATVSNSTFSNNDGGLQGGAIYSYWSNLTVVNSTFVNNHASAYAGAIHVFYGNATLTNNTFTGNAATLPGGYGGAILLNFEGTVTFRNNIFTNNSATNGGNCNNSQGTFNDGGGNLVWGDTTYCPGAHANPLFATLGDYGGDTPTIPLLPGSPALNAASANCPTFDARGVSRGATCDSGAFESQGFTLIKTGGDNQNVYLNAAFANPLALSITSAFGEPVNGGQVMFTSPSSGASAIITASLATISDGAVSVRAVANNVTGAYSVVASAAGATSVNFALANSLEPTPTAIPTSTHTPTLIRTPTRTPTPTLIKTATKTHTPTAVTLILKSIGAQDGWVLESSETSNVGSVINNSNVIINLGDNTTRKQYRSILSFNTGAALPDAAVITRITLKVRKQGILGGGNPVNTFQGFMVDVKNGFFGAATLQTSDFQAAASTSHGPFNTVLVGDWYSINLTGAKTSINKLAVSSGLTQIRLRFKLDDNNNAVANLISLFSGNAPAASQPQLVITYHKP